MLHDPLATMEVRAGEANRMAALMAKLVIGSVPRRSEPGRRRAMLSEQRCVGMRDGDQAC